jgi:primosomal protein N' (replication factor Y)
MVCHSCSFNKLIPSSCPVCNSPDIIFRGAGTKAIEEELRKLFPTARVSRFDKDNKKADSLEQNYDKLLNGEIDIAIGTQIITKGLDLPNLSTVGIVIADSGLFFPDYMSEERTFQNLMQVIGRVGRGHTPGRVILQSYHPESISIQAAINKDFKSLYDQQIVERKKFELPPFVYLLVVSAKRSSQENAQSACEKIIDRIRSLNLKVKINGPAPAFYEKQNGKYVWQLIIKSTDRSNLLKIIEVLPGNYSYDIDPSSLL